MTEPTPYQQMMATQAARKRRAVRLSDYQKDQRKVANTVANRRATRVLIDNHRAEFQALSKTERHALVDLIDAAYAAGDTRTLLEILEAQGR